MDLDPGPGLIFVNQKKVSFADWNQDISFQASAVDSNHEISIFWMSVMYSNFFFFFFLDFYDWFLGINKS